MLSHCHFGKKYVARHEAGRGSMKEYVRRFFEFSNIVRLRILNRMYQVLE